MNRVCKHFYSVYMCQTRFQSDCLLDSGLKRKSGEQLFYFKKDKKIFYVCCNFMSKCFTTNKNNITKLKSHNYVTFVIERKRSCLLEEK